MHLERGDAGGASDLVSRKYFFEKRLGHESSAVKAKGLPDVFEWITPLFHSTSRGCARSGTQWCPAPLTSTPINWYVQNPTHKGVLF